MQKYLGLMVFFFIACNSTTSSKIEVNKRDTTIVITTNKNVADTPWELIYFPPFLKEFAPSANPCSLLVAQCPPVS